MQLRGTLVLSDALLKGSAANYLLVCTVVVQRTKFPLSNRASLKQADLQGRVKKPQAGIRNLRQ